MYVQVPGGKKIIAILVFLRQKNVFIWGYEAGRYMIKRYFLHTYV